MVKNGCQKKTFFCPTTAPQYSDNENFLDPYPNSLWNYYFPPNTSEDNPNFFHIVGYTFAFNGPSSKLQTRYQNKKLLQESHQIGPTSYLDNVADAVLIADVIISGGNSYPAKSTQPFQGIDGGFIKPHLSAHLDKGMPAGGNITYKDGHTQWKKFNSPPSGFTVSPISPWSFNENSYTMVRTASAPYFWW